MSLTDKQLAGHQRRTLRAMRDRLLKMAGEWDGRDQFNATQLTELADQAQSVAAELVEEKAA
jgi:hypothetical protein